MFRRDYEDHETIGALQRFLIRALLPSDPQEFYFDQLSKIQQRRSESVDEVIIRFERIYFTLT